VTLEERLDALEAENARLLRLAERQAENNRRLLALAERQLAALQVMAGVEPIEPEASASPRPCRLRPPARRYRRTQGGAR